jgi:hypothetical protein
LPLTNSRLGADQQFWSVPLLKESQKPDADYSCLALRLTGRLGALSCGVAPALERRRSAELD